MVTKEQVQDYVKNKFNEQDGSDRIEDRGFAYYIDTQPRKYLDTKDKSKMTLGNGPIVIIKETGDIYSFSSSPIHMFGVNDLGVGVNTAKSAEEFNKALNELKVGNDGPPSPVDHIG